MKSLHDGFIITLIRMRIIIIIILFIYFMLFLQMQGAHSLLQAHMYRNIVTKTLIATHCCKNIITVTEH